MGNLELLAVALEEMHHWPEGAQHPFFTWTDHKILKYIRTAKRHKIRQTSQPFSLINLIILSHIDLVLRTLILMPFLACLILPDPDTSSPLLPSSCVVLTWWVERRVTANLQSYPTGCPPHRLLGSPGCVTALEGVLLPPLSVSPLAIIPSPMDRLNALTRSWKPDSAALWPCHLEQAPDTGEICTQHVTLLCFWSLSLPLCLQLSAIPCGLGGLRLMGLSQ